MTDTGDPEQQRREAQLKTTLGSEAIQQLYCFSAMSFNRFLKFSPVFIGSVPADANTTPRLEGGIRDWNLDLSGTRTSVDDTKCRWTLTVTTDSTSKPQLVLNNMTVSLPDTFTIVFTGRMVAQHRDIRTMSDAIKKQFHLDLKAASASNQRYLCWLISFQPDTFTCNPPIDLCTKVATCYQTLFKEDIAALFAVLSTPLDAGEADPPGPFLDAMITVAIAPSRDAADSDTSNNVLVALRDRKKAASVDKSKYPPIWFQQWLRPEDPIDAIFVIDKDSYWTPLLEKIMPVVTAILPNQLQRLLFILYGPNVGETHTTLPVYPADHEGWARTDSKTANYDWVPLFTGPRNDVPRGQDMGFAAFARDRTFRGTVGLVPVYVPMFQRWTYEWIPIEGLIQERVYHTPGNDQVGRKLPMQPFDSLVLKDSKWQSCIMGRIDYQYQGNFMFLDWHIYMRAREFVDGVCTFDFSKATIRALHYGFRWPTLANLDSESFEHDLHEALQHAIYEQFQICIPSGRQVHTSECFHNEAGDLLVPFNLSG